MGNTASVDIVVPLAIAKKVISGVRSYSHPETENMVEPC